MLNGIFLHGTKYLFLTIQYKTCHFENLKNESLKTFKKTNFNIRMVQHRNQKRLVGFRHICVGDCHIV